EHLRGALVGRAAQAKTDVLGAPPCQAGPADHPRAIGGTRKVHAARARHQRSVEVEESGRLPAHEPANGGEDGAWLGAVHLQDDRVALAAAAADRSAAKSPAAPAQLVNQ